MHNGGIIMSLVVVIVLSSLMIFFVSVPQVDGAAFASMAITATTKTRTGETATTSTTSGQRRVVIFTQQQQSLTGRHRRRQEHNTPQRATSMTTWLMSPQQPAMLGAGSGGRVSHTGLSMSEETTPATSSSSSSSSYNMESDFASAFPEKPTMTFEERILKQGDDFCRQVRGSLGENVEPPPELEALEALLEEQEEEGDQDADAEVSSTNATLLSQRMYKLMIECGLRYDKDPETQIMTPTQFDIPSNLQVDAVKKEFYHLYTYGMGLIQAKLLTVDQVKDIVKERIIPRTGLRPEEFDEWLGF